MKRIAIRLTISLLTFAIGVCAASVWNLNTQSVKFETPQSPPTQQQPPLLTGEPEIFDHFMDEATAVKYDGYEASQRHKQVKVEGSNQLTDITYAVITRDGKILDELDGFDGNRHPMGTEIRFGLFHFLGQPSRQLVVEQSQWRNSTYFIVDFSQGYQIVFESGRWGVGEELSYYDVDSDGVFEISQAVTAFAFFENLTFATTHSVEITFKYDRMTRQYIPANHLFQNESLKWIEGPIGKLDRHDQQQFASEALTILLTYIYAGWENQAWTFYDREYTFPDKEVLKQKIKAILHDEPVYRFMYSNN